MSDWKPCRDCEGTGHFFTLTEDEIPSMVELKCERCKGTGSEPSSKRKRKKKSGVKAK